MLKYHWSGVAQAVEKEMVGEIGFLPVTFAD